MKTCLIIETDVNMTSKRAFLHKVTVLLSSTTEKRGLLENKSCVWGFSITTITMDSVKRKTQLENMEVHVARAFLSK